jgi:hypothetical protein
MQAILPTLSDLWPIIIALIVAAAWLIWMRNRVRDHHNILYDEKGQLQVVTVPICAEIRHDCRNGVCGKVDEIKEALKETARHQETHIAKLDVALEKRVRRLHEKREQQEKDWGQELKQIHYFMGAVATKMNIPLTPDQKGPS